MLRLLALACLLAAAAAQRHLYCDSSSPVAVTDRDFYLTTRPSGAASYSQGLSCEFSAVSDEAFLVEVESVRVSTAVFTISSGGQVLFSGSSIPAYKSSMVTPSRSLQIRFDATNDHSSNNGGVRIRVRVLNSSGCPPGWTYLYGNCFGTSNTSGTLDFASAQAACNNMRSNLLLLPSLHSGSIRSFVLRLPRHLRSAYTWVGLTDKTSSGQCKPYWLNGNREYSTREISCVSSGSYSTCRPSERCGTINDKSYEYNYAIYMGDCSRSYRFACSMPPGGASVYYDMPSSVNMTMVWGVVAACLFGFGLLIVGFYLEMRSRGRRAARASSVTASTGRVVSSVTVSTGRVVSSVTVSTGRVVSSVTVSTGRVVESPPSGSYPVQSATQYPQYPPPPVKPQYSADPPTYDSAVGSGNGNAGYMK